MVKVLWKIYLLFSPLVTWLFLGQIYQFYLLENLPNSEEPRTKVAFLKTHKTASTTIQNILFRYAYKNNLTLLLPDSGNYFGANGLSLESVEDTTWYRAKIQPDIFCIHSVWSNMTQVKSILHPNSIYFTILRDPIDVFESLWTYFDCSSHLKLILGWNVSIDEFFNISHRIDPKLVTNQRFSLKHVLFHSFGLHIYANQTMIESKIQEIEDKFDLVMIMEEFETSLILLKDLLNWTYDDLKCLQLNTRMKASKQFLSNATRSKMKVWLRDDYQLYNHFKKKLQDIKIQFGLDQLQNELSKYQVVQENLRSKCPIEFVPKESLPKEDRPFGYGTQAYKMLNSNQECQQLGMQELKFISILRSWQNNRINRLAF